jgi:hypothetical protein
LASMSIEHWKSTALKKYASIILVWWSSVTFSQIRRLRRIWESLGTSFFFYKYLCKREKNSLLDQEFEWMKSSRPKKRNDSQRVKQVYPSWAILDDDDPI